MLIPLCVILCRFGKHRFSLRLCPEYHPDTEAKDCVASLKTNMLGTSYDLGVEWVSPSACDLPVRVWRFTWWTALLCMERLMLVLCLQGGAQEIIRNAVSSPSSSRNNSGSMVYRRNFFGIRGPRKLSVHLPHFADTSTEFEDLPAVPRASSESDRSANEPVPVMIDDGFLHDQHYHQEDHDAQDPPPASGKIHMKNVPPHWHEVWIALQPQTPLPPCSRSMCSSLCPSVPPPPPQKKKKCTRKETQPQGRSMGGW